MTRRQDNLLLNGLAGWRAAKLDGTLQFNDGGSLRLRVQPASLRPLSDASGSFGGLTLPTGLAVDADDQIYIMDNAASVIKRFDPCKTSFEVLPCIGGAGGNVRQFKNAHGIAISCRGDLFVADTDNSRVQIFSLKGLALRRVLGPKFKVKDQELTWLPYDVAVSSDNHAFVTDYGNGLVHVFDHTGRWLAAYDGSGADEPPLERPTAIAIDRNNRLYVVAENKNYVSVLDRDGKFLERLSFANQVTDRFCPVAVAVDASGNICISETTTRRIFFFCQTPDGSYQTAGACPAFEGLGLALAFDSAGNPLLSDAERQRVCRMDRDAAFELEGRFYSEPLDSRLYRCQWHRVLMRALIESGTEVRVDTFTAESPKTDAEIESLPESRWSTGQLNTQVGEGDWDCLIQSPPGRYLWLRLTLTGDGTSTPAIEQARIYYPRASSLQYLPAVYSEDAVSRDFLDRFLSIFDTLWGGISDKLCDIASYFDPAASPADAAAGTDFLSWLASWLGLTLDRHWPVEKRRRLLENAHRLFELRGTPEGLRLHIELYTGREPRILEHFKLRRWLFLNQARLGDQSAVWGAAIINRLQLNEHDRIGEFQLVDSGDPLRDPFHYHAHQFTVFVPLGALSDTQRQTLQRIVEMAKPAHTLGAVQTIEPRLRVGLQAFVGVDTVIGRYPDKVVEGETRLGCDAVLGQSADEAKAPTMRVGIRTRIGSSTLID